MSFLDLFFADKDVSVMNARFAVMFPRTKVLIKGTIFLTETNSEKKEIPFSSLKSVSIRPVSPPGNVMIMAYLLPKMMPWCDLELRTLNGNVVWLYGLSILRVYEAMEVIRSEYPLVDIKEIPADLKILYLSGMRFTNPFINKIILLIGVIIILLILANFRHLWGL